MRRDDVIRLQHMRDSAREALSFAAGKARSDLDTNSMLVLSLVKSMKIIGEAANKVSANCRAESPEIPWLDIVAMRNHLIHAYFDINLDIVWHTVTQELPPLVVELEKALAVADRE
jgi:uncharacterized protein with HEPN domain